MAFRKEADLHRQLLKAINSDSLADVILDSSGMATVSSEKGDDKFPQFSIDHLAREAALRAGRLVLESFNLLVLLTSDKNVSITQHEMLRPDIVCINPELGSIVIFELKTSIQTGRQSLTELLAYEQEVKNLFPFLSTYDVHLVLVSSEWSLLMDHAVSAAVTWSGRKILCLEADEEGGKLQLRTRVPSAWKVTGSVYFPEDALPCVTVCLYEKDAYSEGWKKDVDGGAADLDPRILDCIGNHCTRGRQTWRAWFCAALERPAEHFADELQHNCLRRFTVFVLSPEQAARHYWAK